MTVLDSLYGTGDAPLVATWAYTFNRALGPAGEPSLTIPVNFINSRDDFGRVQSPEQEVYLVGLLRSLGVQARSGYPGEWFLADADAMDLVWTALAAALGPPAKAVPRATASRDVSERESPAVSGALTRRFLALVDRVLGPGGEPFKCIESRIDNDSYEALRNEVWRREGVTVKIDATGIQSAYGVHGESCDYTMTTYVGDPRKVGMYARIDMRSGGYYSVTVEGVQDAQALVDAFVAGQSSAT